MTFVTVVKRDPRFTKENISRALAEAAYETVREGRGIQQRKMEASVPAGLTYSIGRGDGYETRFTRSKRGQRPAIQTRKLLNSFRAKKIGRFSAELSCIAETDEGFDYGEYLQKKLGRKILTDEDRTELAALYFKNCEKKLQALRK